MLTEGKDNKRPIDRRVWISAGAPILVLVLVVAMLFCALIANFAQRQDRAFADDSRHLVQSMLHTRADALTRLTLDYAMWNDAYEHVTLRWDPAWLDDNYYTAVADALLIVRADGTVRYEWRAEGIEVSDGLIAQTVRASRTDFALPNAANTQPEDLAAQSLVSQDGRMAQISLAVIGPETAPERRARGGDPADYVIVIDVLNRGDIAELGATIGLENLVFSDSAAEGGDTIALNLQTPTGRHIGALTWTHERPGSATFALQFWPIMLCLVIIGVLAAFVTRRLVAGHVRFASRAEAALESSRLRAEFITTMSHELRTPLNAIIGYTELIQEQIGVADDADTVRTDTNRILAAAKHLRQLVTDILDHARIDAGKLQLEIEPVSVEGILEEVIEISEPLALAQNNVLTITAPGKDLLVLADDTRLRQILLNLVSNAIKFTRNGEVSIAAEMRQSRIEFSVSDSGIGIAPDELELLFKPFVQANADIQKKYGGTGLGLSISQKLAHAMGGAIGARSTPGKGSVFTLTLPLATAELRAAA